MMETIDFFGCSRHDDVFAVKSEELTIDTEMKSAQCAKKIKQTNKWLYTKVCNNESCNLSFIGSRSYDFNGVLFMDTVSQEKLDRYEFNRGWLVNVTMLSSNGDLAEDSQSSE